MLHTCTKFRGIGPMLPEKNFEGFLPFSGRSSHLGNVTQMPRTNFCSPEPWRLHQNLPLIGQTVWVKMFEIVNGGTRD